MVLADRVGLSGAPMPAKAGRATVGEVDCRAPVVSPPLLSAVVARACRRQAALTRRPRIGAFYQVTCRALRSAPAGVVGGSEGGQALAAREAAGSGSTVTSVP